MRHHGYPGRLKVAVLCSWKPKGEQQNSDDFEKWIHGKDGDQRERLFGMGKVSSQECPLHEMPDAARKKHRT